MQSRQSSAGWLLLLILSILILGVAWLYTNWKSGQEVLPPGLTISGMPMGGMTRAQALNAIALAYTLPITVHYENEVTLLLPEMVDLTLDKQATAENLDAKLAARADTSGFLRYVLERVLLRNPETLAVDAVVTYSRERVDAFLNRLAQKYDRAPQAALPLPEAGAFRPPRAGTRLLVEASRPKLIAAIVAAVPAQRVVLLEVEVEPAPRASVEVLRESLTLALRETAPAAGIFVKDLRGGQEFCLNCHSAYAEVGLLKVAAVLTLLRTLDADPTAQTTHLITGTLWRTDHSVADQLLAYLGAGDPAAGALQVTEFLWQMGLKSSFVAAPYMQREGPPPEIVTPANSQPGGGQSLDPFGQTTPMEMGLLLESVYQCRQDGGALRVIYADIAPSECAALLSWLAQSPSWLRAGVPNVEVAARLGWSGATYAEAALLYGPQTDVVVVVMLYQPAWLTPDESAGDFAAVGRLIYSFFNGAP